MKKKSYVIVVNLKSRQAVSLVEEVIKTFKSHKRKVKVLGVQNPKNLNNAFKRAMDLNPDVIALGGGDGTLITGIEYLTKHGYSKEIGLLPMGTANYLARNLGIPLTIEGSIKTLLKGRSRQIPLGEANGKFFSLMFMVGLTQVVAEQVSDGLKKWLGQSAYLIELFRQTKQHKPFRYEIESPDLKAKLTGTTHQIFVYNSDMNQQLKLVPEHRLTKKTLKVVINKCGKSKTKFYVSYLTHIFTRGRFRPYMRVFETAELKITTTPKLKADYDGEPFGKSPFKVKVLDKKVKVIC